MFCLSHLPPLSLVLTSPHLSFSDPNEIGGLYWILCLLLGQATSFVAVYLYSSVGTIHKAFKDDDLWAFVGVLEASFVIFFAMFVATMDQKYRRTFFSRVTAKQYNIMSFREATSDKARHDVFGLHPSYYRSIRVEVKQWVRQNYNTWLEENPEWFTERLRTRIPIDMIPEGEVKRS